jgi:hypothetical protein
MSPPSSGLKDKRSKKAGGKQNIYAGLLLGLFLELEDGGDIFLRNVG